jgi:hypothetical protein
MLDLAQLQRQNRDITEIVGVFLSLAHDHVLCDSPPLCDLFFDGVNRIRAHQELVDELVREHLLDALDPRIRSLGRKLMAESGLLQRTFESFVNRWNGAGPSRTGAGAGVVTGFLSDSEDLFALVLDRIERETTYLYPLFEDAIAA